jgi:serine/threonine-protein kinase
MSQGQGSIGDYRLVRYLGGGGMADLYLVEGPSPPRPLVLKRLQRRFLEHPQVVRRFIEEGRILARIEHPNVVRLHTAGEHESGPYLVLEYIAGPDLGAVIDQAGERGLPLPCALAAGIVDQVARGLDCVHRLDAAEERPFGWVHGDVSPGNVMLSWGGTAKLLDFGVARRADLPRDGEGEAGPAGNVRYMAPEQIRGEAVDMRADLFSLGVILFELVVGQRLFAGPPAAVMYKVCEGAIPRPRELRPEIPEALETLLLRLLARDRSARPPSAAALRDELHRYLASEGAGAGADDVARYLRQLFPPPEGPNAAEPIDDGGSSAEFDER